MSRWALRSLELAGSLLLLVAYPAYSLLVVLYNELTWPRWLGMFGVLGGVLLGIGALLALIPCPARLRRALGALLYLEAVTQALLIGASMVAHGLRSVQAPLALALLGLLALAGLRYVRATQDEQDLIVRLLGRAGAVLLVLPALALPWLVGAALAQARMTPAPLAPAAPRAGAPHTVVLVTMDALRARSTGPVTTPHLRALETTADTYGTCVAAGEHTMASLPTILSGRPVAHLFARGATRGYMIPGGTVRGLAGYLRGAGYRTLAMLTLMHPAMFGMPEEYDALAVHAPMYPAALLNGRHLFPVDQLAPYLRQALRGRAPETSHLADAATSVTEALADLQAHPGPAFVWLHLAVPHQPLLAVPATGSIDPMASYSRVAMPDHPTPGQREELSRAYERYVRAGDAQLGRLIAGLRSQGRWDDTMMVVTSDHGESFNPPDMLHANGTTGPDVALVPLVVHHARQAAARRVEGVVGHDAIAPLILQDVYAQLPPAPPEGWALPGTRDVAYCWGLLNVYSGEGRWPRESVSAYTQDRWLRYLPGTGVASLHAYRTDRLGLRDRSRAEPERARQLLADLRSHVPMAPGL